MFKPRISKFALTLILSLASTQLLADEIQILDSHGKLLHTLNKRAQVKQFQKIWQEKQLVALFAKPNWDYQVIIKLPQHAPETWWYASDGHAQRADTDSNGPYRLAEVDRVNTLFGIKKPQASR